MRFATILAGREAVAAVNRQERKVWTSQERIPAKGWGPQGYGKCNRKQTVFRKKEQGEMFLLKREALSW